MANNIFYIAHLMKSFLKYLLLPSTMLIASCFWYPDPNFYAKITNNSEHNITRVVIMNRYSDVKISESGNELIAKNGGSKTYNTSGIPGFIVCVEAENALEPECTVILSSDEDTKYITWNGNGGSGWVPVTMVPNCPKVFKQCKEIKND